MKRSLWFILAAALLLNNCSENPSSKTELDPLGNLELSVTIEKVGALKKSMATSEIQLSQAYIRLINDGDLFLLDSATISDNNQISLVRSYSSLPAGNAWVVQITTVDNNDITIHSGSRPFSVIADDTARVTVSVSPQYSMLSATFNDIKDSVNMIELLVDSVVVSDSSFAAQSMVGDSITLTFDYVSVGTRTVTMNAYGLYMGQQVLLYSGDTTLSILPSGDQFGAIELYWQNGSLPAGDGSASFSVSLGRVGTTSLHGSLINLLPPTPTPTPPANMPAQGTRFAFTLGYNDMDEDGATVGSLRWENTDPFGPYETSAENAQSWGDLEINNSGTIDPNDDVLMVPTLSSTNVNAFSTNDSVISDFWYDEWASRDSMELNTSINSYPLRDPWSSSNDARLTAKAGAGEEGLYLLIEIHDDIWVDPMAGSNGWQYDAVDILIDALNSSNIGSSDESIMVMPSWGWAITFSTVQYQLFMGNTSLPDAMRMAYYDNLFFTWAENTVQLDQSAVLYNGLSVEAGIVDNTTKFIEMFIPWTWVGNRY